MVMLSSVLAWSVSVELWMLDSETVETITSYTARAGSLLNIPLILQPTMSPTALQVKVTVDPRVAFTEWLRGQCDTCIVEDGMAIVLLTCVLKCS